MGSTVKISIAGAAGRLGSAIAAEAQKAEGVEIAGLFESPRHGAVGGTVAGITVAGDIAEASAGADVVVDFTTPEASIECARWCAENGKALVVGTTGFSPGQEKEVKKLAAELPCVMAPNMSAGVNLLMELAHLAAETLEGFDAAVVETHHAAKKDAPSGTALALARAVSGARGGEEIDTVAVRGGTAAGDHTVMFLGGGERVLLSHVAENKNIFAAGAVKAAVWVCGKPPGIYGMREVLGFAPTGLAV